MAHVVVAAGVHAARHLQLDFADIVEIVQSVELFVDLLGDGNRAGVGQ